MEQDKAVDDFLEVTEKSAKERIQQLCLERCDSMICGNYEFPDTVSKADWIVLVVITVGILIVTSIGNLL